MKSFKTSLRRHHFYQHFRGEIACRYNLRSTLRIVLKRQGVGLTNKCARALNGQVIHTLNPQLEITCKVKSQVVIRILLSKLRPQLKAQKSWDYMMWCVGWINALIRDNALFDNIERNIAFKANIQCNKIILLTQALSESPFEIRLLLLTMYISWLY